MHHPNLSPGRVRGGARRTSPCGSCMRELLALLLHTGVSAGTRCSTSGAGARCATFSAGTWCSTIGAGVKCFTSSAGAKCSTFDVGARCSTSGGGARCSSSGAGARYSPAQARFLPERSRMDTREAQGLGISLCHSTSKRRFHGANGPAITHWPRMTRETNFAGIVPLPRELAEGHARCSSPREFTLPLPRRDEKGVLPTRPTLRRPSQWSRKNLSTTQTHRAGVRCFTSSAGARCSTSGTGAKCIPNWGANSTSSYK